MEVIRGKNGVWRKTFFFSHIENLPVWNEKNFPKKISKRQCWKCRNATSSITSMNYPAHCQTNEEKPLICCCSWFALFLWFGISGIAANVLLLLAASSCWSVEEHSVAADDRERRCCHPSSAPGGQAVPTKAVGVRERGGALGFCCCCWACSLLNRQLARWVDWCCW